MKGFVACCLAAVPTLAALPLKRPIHLFITYDEETDMSDAMRLIADLAESGMKSDWCIVGELSRMRPIIAHKGSLALRLTARGLPGHPSQPGRGVNAVHAIAETIVYIAAEQRRFAHEGPFSEGFDPPRTTPHVGTVRGGTVPNIIPDSATCMIEWRTIPGYDANAEVERLHAYVALRRPGNAGRRCEHRLRLRNARRPPWHGAQPRAPTGLVGLGVIADNLVNLGQAIAAKPTT